MKRVGFIALLAGVSLLAASFAFADDGGKGNGKDKQKDGQKCQNVSLKGTAPATTFTVSVDKANKAGRDLKTATVTFSGKVSINGQLCASGDSGPSGSTLKLRNLKVGKPSSDD